MLSDPENQQVLNYRKVILTKSYLMMRNSFLTYIPLNQLRTMALKSETHRSVRRIYLTISPKCDTKGIYIFDSKPMLRSVQKKKQEIAEQLRAHMSVYAPDCKLYLM